MALKASLKGDNGSFTFLFYAYYRLWKLQIPIECSLGMQLSGKKKTEARYLLSVQIYSP